MLTSLRPLVRPGTWLGAAAMLLLAASELARTGRWDQTWAGSTAASLMAGVETRWVALIAIALFTCAWASGRPRRDDGWPGVAVVAALWTAPLLLLWPVLSTDASSYADLGWSMLQGSNPYLVGLGTTGSPFEVARVWEGTTSIYPPGALLLFSAVVAVSGSDAVWSVIGMRALAMVGLVALGIGLWRLAARYRLNKTAVLWLGVLNPLVLVHGVAGAHIDLLMVGLMVLGLSLATRRRWFAAAVLIGLAATVKQPAFVAMVAVPFLAQSAPTSRIWRQPRWWLTAVAASTVTVATFAAVSSLSGLGWGWVGASGSPDQVSTANLITLLSQWLPAQADSFAVIVPGLAVVGALAAALMWGRTRPILAIVAISVAWVAGFGAYREWYLLLFVPLVPIALGQAPRWARLVLGGFASVAMLHASIYGTFREYGRAPIETAFWASTAISVVVIGLITSVSGRTVLDADAAAAPVERVKGEMDRPFESREEMVTEAQMWGEPVSGTLVGAR